MTETPPLTPGFHAVPPGMVATVVTYLEMRTTPETTPLPPDAALVPAPTEPETYRSLFRAVGEDWLWFSRLQIPDQALRDILEDPAYEAYALVKDGRQIGLLELDFREESACELAFFGLVKDAVGTGLGRALMGEAIRRAFARPISRFHVHTCTLDSPQALGFYRKSGFTPIKQEIEIAPDPRLTGDLLRSAGAHVPIYD